MTEAPSGAFVVVARMCYIRGVTENYNETFRVRCTKEQKAAFEVEARQMGMKSPELARLRLFGSPTRTPSANQISTSPAASASFGAHGPAVGYVTYDELTSTVESAVDSAVSKALNTINQKGKTTNE